MSDATAGITRTAVLASLKELRDYVVSACERAGLDRQITLDLKLAADEICANIIEHGYEGKPAGPITLVLEVDDQEACLTIEDKGQSFPPETAPEPDLESDWVARPVGGLGWHLVRQVVDRYEYSTDPVAGNRLRLYKQLPASQRTEI